MQALNNIVKFNRVSVPAVSPEDRERFSASLLEAELEFIVSPEIYCDGVDENPDTLSMTIFFDPEFAHQIVNKINDGYPDAIAFNESTESFGSIRVECITPEAFNLIMSRIAQA